MDNGGALHTDEPITGGDSSPDLLNRTPFARRVAETICTIPCSSGFVISIEGPWGFGKTSVLNLIAAHFGTVAAPERPILCTFNPWMVGNVENLAQSFLIQLASAIGLAIQSDQGNRIKQGQARGGPRGRNPRKPQGCGGCGCRPYASTHQGETS